MSIARTRRGNGEWRYSLMVIVAGTVCLAGSAHAQYRCIQADGGVSYQQMPCPATAGGKKMELSSTATSAPGGKEDRTDWARVIRSQPPAGNAAASPDSQARNCPTPQQIRSMEFEASKIANRKNAAMQTSLARARACQ